MQGVLSLARVKGSQTSLQVNPPSQVLHSHATSRASYLGFSIIESYAYGSYTLRSSRVVPDSSSSRESSPRIDEEGPGVLLKQPALEIRKGRDTLVRTSLAILFLLLLTTSRLQGPAAVNLTRCRMRVFRRLRMLRGKS